MNSKRDFYMDAFLNIIWLSVFYGVFIAPAVVFLHLRTDILLPISAVILFVFLFARRLIKYTAIMFLVHLIVPIAAFYLAPDLFSRVLYVGVATVLAIFSLQQRHTRSLTFVAGFIYAAPMVLIVLALLVGNQGYTHVYTTYAVLIIFSSIGSKLHIRMVQVNDSLEVITQTSTQPVKKILAFDYKAMLVLTVIMIGLTIFFHLSLMRPALEAVSGIRLNVQIDPITHTPEAPPDTPGDDILGPGGMAVEGLYRPPSPFWLALERLIMLLVPPVVVLGVGYFIFRLAREVYKKLDLKTAKDHEYASGYEDIKEFISTPKTRRPWFFGSRGEHKLRKLFRETMTRHIKKGVPIKKSDTPMQMAEKIKAEDISNLVEEYAAVRYGNYK